MQGLPAHGLDPLPHPPTGLDRLVPQPDHLAVGLLLRRRLMVVPGLAFGAIAGALFAFERQAGGGLPPWAILALVGVFLIGAGFLFLIRRDYWERAQRAALGWWQAWEV